MKAPGGPQRPRGTFSLCWRAREGPKPEFDNKRFDPFAGFAQAQQVAQAAASAFERYPHWQRSSHQEQEVRKALYKGLIDAGADNVVELAKDVMRMLRRASS